MLPITLCGDRAVHGNTTCAARILQHAAGGATAALFGNADLQDDWRFS